MGKGWKIYFHSILDVINKLDTQIQGVGGFALKTKNVDWSWQFKNGDFGLHKGCLQGIIS